jgi:PAS domain S-box-containing protein
VLDDPRLLAEAALPAADLAARFAEIPGVPRAVVSVPVLHRERPVAVLVLGSSDYPDIPDSMIAALDNLTTLVGNAVARIRAEQSRGDAVADLEAFIAAAPLAVWSLDVDGKVRIWNRAAERLFGWRASEVLNRPPLFVPPGLEEGYARLHKVERSSVDPEGLQLRAIVKTGELITIRAFSAPFRDVVGKASRVIVMAVDATLGSRDPRSALGKDGAESASGRASAAEAARGLSALLAELASAVMGKGGSGDEAALALADSIVKSHGGRLVVDTLDESSVALSIVLPRQTAPADELTPSASNHPLASGAKILVVDHDARSRAELGRILRRLGRPFVVCGSGLDAVERFRQASEAGEPFSLVILELVMPAGPGGLETAARLKAIDSMVKVVVSSDSAVLGYEYHGVAAALRKPYATASVAELLAKA